MNPDAATRIDDISMHTLSAVVCEPDRTVLTILIEETLPLSRSELAVHVRKESETNHGALELRLAHSVLPALEDVGLIETADDGITTTDHPLYSSPNALRLLQQEIHEELLQVLQHPRRRHILGVLEQEDLVIERHELADAVAAIESGDEQVPSSTVNDVLVSLHHVHLPVLEECGLVEYDGELVTRADSSDTSGETPADTVAKSIH